LSRGNRLGPGGLHRAGRHEELEHQRREHRDRQADALRLLGTVSFGRVVFTLSALPAIRPVNHLLDGDALIIRTHQGAALLPDAGDGVVVADEADDIDPVGHLGRSVIVVGGTELVGDAATHYMEQLRRWVAASMDLVVRIRREIVTGFAWSRTGRRAEGSWPLVGGPGGSPRVHRPALDPGQRVVDQAMSRSRTRAPATPASTMVQIASAMMACIALAGGRLAAEVTVVAAFPKLSSR
jgi:hypothetical protein